jgi:putative ABC transport system ATP-binding protein
MASSLLQVRGLARRVDERILWQGLSFDLVPGQCLGVWGPAGSGKTLLLRAITLLDPLQEGLVTLLGRTPQEWSLPSYRARVMVVPQRAVTFSGSVQHNLLAPFQWPVHRHRSFPAQRLNGWLRQLGRDASFLSKDAEHLSGGEAQLLALIRAMQLDPQVLLLDEPTASLDDPTTIRAESLLRQWQGETDGAIVMVSHAPEQMARFCDSRLDLA